MSSISADVSACSIREKHNTKWTACLLPNLLEHTVIGLNTNHVISFLKHKCYSIARCRYDGGRVEIPAEISQTLRIWHERTDRQTVSYSANMWGDRKSFCFLKKNTIILLQTCMIFCSRKAQKEMLNGMFVQLFCYSKTECGLLINNKNNNKTPLKTTKVVHLWYFWSFLELESLDFIAKEQCEHC